jgi:hypothetical protein
MSDKLIDELRLHARAADSMMVLSGAPFSEAADEIDRLRAELAREKRVKGMLNDQIDLERDNAKTLAYWLMHPYVFVHERIIEQVDLDLVPYHGTATPAI